MKKIDYIKQQMKAIVIDADTHNYDSLKVPKMNKNSYNPPKF